ncbi:MAG: adenylate kinase [Dysgonamonadaceae bacterium]|jgi:adenylate kinase|nr:adenylate kinase [Dysgonamonadaceae bacterium]
MLNVVIFGPPGSGKGTQSELISQKYALHHISTGEILRKEIEEQTERGVMVHEHISKGHLIPDGIIIDMLESLLDEHRNQNGFIFDGFPRTLMQAEALDRLLKDRDASIAVILDLDVQNEVLIERLLKRGKIFGRSDDNPETIFHRLSVYQQQTEPLKKYYKKQGKLFTLKGIDTIEEVFDKITVILDKIVLELR